ncbi:MAG: nuclear transport factor 2 family protein [Ignavibacteria bacterium]|nr:nuclear transport factor 2 family protein [Ignavibacteria bacterium]
MKSSLILVSLIVIIIFSSCKSEEKKMEPKQMQRQQYVLPPKIEQPEQTIQKQENIDPKVSAEVIAVIKENIAATQAKDKERVLKTIHKDCPQLRSTIQGMDYVFAQFDLIFELEKIEVLEVNGDDAKVYYVQTTQAIRGEGFAPTRASGIHEMKKENGKWKIYKTDYLTNEPM